VIYRKKLKAKCIKELPTALHRVINFDLIYLIPLIMLCSSRKYQVFPKKGRDFPGWWWGQGWVVLKDQKI